MGGLVGADDNCNKAAVAAGLPGIYRAWVAGISDSVPPPDPAFYQSVGPYVRVDGTEVANDWSDLVDGSLSAAINVDENGDFNPVEVWTNVAPDGSRGGLANPDSCATWGTFEGLTGRFGLSTSTGAAWTDQGFDSCEQEKALYCFGQ